MNITPVRIYINGNGSISFFGANNSLITNLQNLNGAKQSNGQIIFDGDDKTVSFYVYQLTSIESATFTLPYSALDSRFFNPSVYSAKLNSVYQDVAEYVLVNKNGGASFVGGVVAVYPNYASFPATGQEAVIYIDEGTNQAYFWDGSAYQLLVSTGVQQYASFALFPVTGSANVIYIDMSTFEPYVWDGAAYESLSGGNVVWGSITGTLSDQTDLQAALDAKVPYTGATQDVDLGEYELKAGQIEFDTTPTGTAGAAVMRWNDTDGTADLGLKGGNVTLQVGQEMLIRAVNKSGGDLLEANYQAVRLRLVSEGGAAGQRLAVKLALADSDINSATTIGLVTETILDNQEGFITTIGNVREINTTGSLQGETWVDGDILYLSPTVAGQLTNIKPVAPDHLVVVGYVEYAHAIHGKIYVKCDNGYELDELHNVYINAPTTWQVLRYDATAGYWTNSSLTASILPGGIDASKIGAGTVDNTEFGYLDGVTSSIQTQLDGKVPTTRTLTINGTTQDLSADRTFTIATGLTVGTTPITSGTVGRILFEGTGNVLQESSKFTFDEITNSNTRLLMKHETAQASIIDFSATIGNYAGGFLATGPTFSYGTYAANSANLTGGTGGVAIRVTSSSNFAIHGVNASVDNATKQFQVFGATGNVLIQNGGTFTDAGFKLDVNGTARFVTNDWRINNAANTRTIVVSGINLDMAFSHGIISTGGGFITGNISMGSLATGLANTIIRGFNNAQLDLNGDNTILQSRPNTASPLRLLSGSLSATSKGTVYISDYANLATAVNASAQLQIDSTTQGFLPPRMTTTQKNAIASPAAGLVVYDNTLNGLNFYNGTAWSSTGLIATQVTPVTLTAASWTLVSGLYEYNYSNAAILSTSIVDVIPLNSTIAIVQAAQVLPETLSSAGSVKLYATNLPTADIIVSINIFN